MKKLVELYGDALDEHRIPPLVILASFNLDFLCIHEHGSLTIQDFKRLCPEVNRRSLQRDLKIMLDMGLLVSEGATNKLIYRMKETG